MFSDVFRIAYLDRPKQKYEDSLELILSKDYLPEYLERMKVSIGRVEFMEEQGLDYGGVRPSFFKSVVHDIVNNFFETIKTIASPMLSFPPVFFAIFSFSSFSLISS